MMKYKFHYSDLVKVIDKDSFHYGVIGAVNSVHPDIIYQNGTTYAATSDKYQYMITIDSESGAMLSFRDDQLELVNANASKPTKKKFF